MQFIEMDENDINMEIFFIILNQLLSYFVIRKHYVTTGSVIILWLFELQDVRAFHSM